MGHPVEFEEDRGERRRFLATLSIIICVVLFADKIQPKAIEQPATTMATDIRRDESFRTAIKNQVKNLKIYSVS